jgi:DNA-binding CsgD family transcriptional regulator
MTLNDAAALVEESLAISREIGWRAGEAYSLLNCGFIDRQRLQFGDAIAVTQAARAIAEEIDHLEWLTCAWHALGMYASDLLDPASARSNGERALTTARASGSLHFVHTAAGGLISNCIAGGDIKAATDVSRQFDPELPMRTVSQWRVWLARAELALASGDPQHAIDITERIFEVVRDLPGEGDIPAIALLRGDAFVALNDDIRAERSLRAAAEGASVREMRPLLCRIHIALANLFDRTGRAKEARASVAVVHDIVERVSAGLPNPEDGAAYRDRVLAMLPRQSGPQPPSPRHPLTRREREVALLVAQGRSNREIADQLFVGERTVETHVGNILGKLDFASRAQIAAWVVESGLNQQPS